MRKLIKLPGIIALFIIFVICISGCFKADPKALAKETYEIAKETMSAVFNSTKAADLQKKAAAVSEKVNRLSAADKTIYNVELMRLAGDDLGNLIDIGSNILSTSQGILDFSVQAHDAVQQVVDTINSIDTEGLQSTIDSAAKQVTDLLDSFRKLSP